MCEAYSSSTWSSSGLLQVTVIVLSSSDSCSRQLRSLGDGGGRPLARSMVGAPQAARVGRRFHGAAATAIAMDLGPPSSVGGRDVVAEDGDEGRHGGGGRGQGEVRVGRDAGTVWRQVVDAARGGSHGLTKPHT